MASQEKRQWVCKNVECGAVLGIIRWNGANVPQLMILRHAVKLTDENPAQVDVIGTLEGWMPVRCDICEHVRVWEVSSQVVSSLAERLGAVRLAALLEKVIRKDK